MLAWEQVRAAVGPLRLVFWGGLLWILDVSFASTSNGRGFRFDVLNDTVGTLLIAVGAFRLGAAPVGGRYAGAMGFVKGVALASVVETAMKHVVFPHPIPLSLALTALGLAQLAATALFCLSMRWFCEQAGLPRVAASWRMTLLLFLFVYVVPLGGLYLVSSVALLSGRPFHVNLGPAALLLVPVFAVPLVHLFVSTSRMKRAAAGRGAEVPPPGGFPVVLPPPTDAGGWGNGGGRAP